MPHLIHAPGPATGLLGLSVARRFSASPIKFLTDMHDEYGPIVHLRFGPQHLILAFAPEAIQEVLVTQNKSFPKQQQNLRAVRQIDGNGLITTEGDFWLRQRRLVLIKAGAADVIHKDEVDSVRLFEALGRALAAPARPAADS